MRAPVMPVIWSLAKRVIQSFGHLVHSCQSFGHPVMPVMPVSEKLWSFGHFGHSSHFALLWSFIEKLGLGCAVHPFVGAGALRSHDSPGASFACARYFTSTDPQTCPDGARRKYFEGKQKKRLRSLPPLPVRLPPPTHCWSRSNQDTRCAKSTIRVWRQNRPFLRL